MTSSLPEGRPSKLDPNDEIDFHLMDFVRETQTDTYISLTAQKQIIDEMHSGDVVTAEQAKQQLIFSHLGLVAAVANEYKTESPELYAGEEGSIELMEEGTTGLLIAAQTYDANTDFSDHAVSIIGKYIREGSFEESDFDVDYEAMPQRLTERMYRSVTKLRIQDKDPAIKLNSANQNYLASHLGLESLAGISLAKLTDVLSEDESKVLEMFYLADIKIPSKDITAELGINAAAFKRIKRRAVYKLAANLHRL